MAVADMRDLVCEHHCERILVGQRLEQPLVHDDVAAESGEGVHDRIVVVVHLDAQVRRQALCSGEALAQLPQVRLDDLVRRPAVEGGVRYRPFMVERKQGGQAPGGEKEDAAERYHEDQQGAGELEEAQERPALAVVDSLRQVRILIAHHGVRASAVP
jgi:hypothetical protein